MPTPPHDLELLQNRVNTRVHWGDTEAEIHDWLKEENGVVGRHADEMYQIASAARRRTVRGRAILKLVFSLLGFALAAGFVLVQIKSGLFVIGLGSILIIVGGFLSIGVFFRSLFQISTGRTRAPID